jgi:hypothetical protein
VVATADETNPTVDMAVGLIASVLGNRILKINK